MPEWGYAKSVHRFIGVFENSPGDDRDSNGAVCG
jgi:hypothetical protein